MTEFLILKTAMVLLEAAPLGLDRTQQLASNLCQSLL